MSGLFVEVQGQRGQQEGQQPERGAHQAPKARPPVDPAPGGDEAAEAGLGAGGCQQARACRVGEVLGAPPCQAAQVVHAGRPAVGVRDDQGRRAEEEEEVGRGQVKDVDAHGAPLPAGAQQPDHQAVFHNAAHAGEQDQRVQHRPRRVGGRLPGAGSARAAAPGAAAME